MLPLELLSHGGVRIGKAAQMANILVSSLITPVAAMAVLLSGVMHASVEAQTRPGCAYGRQTLSRHTEPTDGATTRSFTVCPGAAARICVEVDSGQTLKINIDGFGSENREVRRLCRSVRTTVCKSVSIEILNDGPNPVGYRMSCE